MIFEDINFVIYSNFFSGFNLRIQVVGIVVGLQAPSSSHVYKLSDSYGNVYPGRHVTSHIIPEVVLVALLLSVELSVST